jgi:CRP-like cAMP-binding protein
VAERNACRRKSGCAHSRLINEEAHELRSRLENDKTCPSDMKTGDRQRGSKTGNRLLDGFSPAVLAHLHPSISTCKLAFGQELHAPGETAHYVYFPVRGLISVVTTMEDGTSIEMGVAGHEGMFSVASILGDNKPTQRAMVQLPGTAWRSTTAAFRNAMEAHKPMRALLLRYVQATLTAIGQSAACNRFHTVEQRCARWLLGTHDRAGSDTFVTTHEFLSTMLGVRRPGVTIAALSLQSAGLISYRRGIISITDRNGLEAASCECYRAIRDEYDRQLNA